ncbi:LysM peptidoglycan-binding domain-containing protein [Haloplasma contractile]|uniref:SpoVID-dependent spore coat assembly factor SafA protein n=1 Tax=Haloplasma contractile SSD-17B TaxID=1033810 RepID=U2FNR4_9MOLU|nr:LysM domain-containing protein [Haloplasma contractile]ERJ12759.1 SpoVID-dependent spore coat assembly factor SafA protein [Haloplasma contractile SSD-17B]
MKIHIVQVNDTIDRIAKKYDVDVEDIKKHNRQINNFKSIAPGMKLKIPVLTQTVEEELIDNSPSVESYYPSLDDINAYEEQDQDMDSTNKKEKVEVNNQTDISKTEEVNTIYGQYEDGKELENELEIEGYSGDIDNEKQDQTDDGKQYKPSHSANPYSKNDQQNQQSYHYNSPQQPYQQYAYQQPYQVTPQYQYTVPQQYGYNQHQPTYYQGTPDQYYANPNFYRSGGPCPCEQQVSTYQQPAQNQMQQVPIGSVYQQPSQNQMQQVPIGSVYQQPTQNQMQQAPIGGVYQQPTQKQMQQAPIGGVYQQPTQNQSYQTNQGTTYHQTNRQSEPNSQELRALNGQHAQGSGDEINIGFNQQYPQSQNMNSQTNMGGDCSKHESTVNQNVPYFNPHIPFNVPVSQDNSYNENIEKTMTNQQKLNQPNQMYNTQQQQQNMTYNMNPNPYVNMGPVNPNEINRKNNNGNSSNDYASLYQSNGNQQGLVGSRHMQEIFRKEVHNGAIMNEPTNEDDTDGFTVTKIKKKIHVDLRKNKK